MPPAGDHQNAPRRRPPPRARAFFVGLDARGADAPSSAAWGSQSTRPIVRENLPLVRAVAIRYRRYGLPLDDLASRRGSIGLLRAIDKYDPARGARFDVYARTPHAAQSRMHCRTRPVSSGFQRPVVDRRRLVAKAICAGLAAAS